MQPVNNNSKFQFYKEWMSPTGTLSFLTIVEIEL